MNDSSADRDPLDRLAEEFVARYRSGQRPSLTEYAERHPELAGEIRDLFPALVEVEQLKPATADRTGEFAPADPADPDRVGEFRILRRVGRGGMGVVYEAVQESLGRHVALKILPPEALLDPRRLERFRREARAAARLHHTNIVPVFGVGEAGGRHYYAMQFIAGHPLDAVIDEVRRLKEKSAVLPAAPPAVSGVAAALLTGTFAPRGEAGDVGPPGAAGDSGGPTSPASPALSGSMSEGGRHYFAAVAGLGAQVADGLAYAHAQGILHRDVKPANLLLDLRGTVWVTDFGLAKAADADDLTHAGDVVGTLRYLAPERFDGPGDHRADVYALGLTLYELLTLRPAFTAENRAKLVEQVVAASPPRPRSVNPAIPRDLETIVLKAIARDPAMRYQSAAELAEDLRRFTEDRPIRARRASSAEQAWRWCRRNKAVASLVAAVVLVSVAGATVASLIARREQKTAAELEQTLGERDRTAAELGTTLAAKDRFAADLDAALKLSEGRRGDLERNRDELRHTLYASLINRAQSALNDGRIPNAVELLRETTPKPGEPDLRGWEWNYLNNLLRPDREFLLAGPGELIDSYDCVLSHDGTRVLVPHISGDARPDPARFYTVRETLTGRTVGRVPKRGHIPLAEGDGPGSGRTDPVFSQDGRYVFVRVSHGVPAKNPNDPWTYVVDHARSRLWSVETGEPVPAPAELAGWRNVILGPDAAWAVWFDAAQDVEKTGTNSFPNRVGPAEVTCSRWDRATGKVTKLTAFKIGKGYGYPELTPDGGTLYWLAEARVSLKGGATSFPKVDAENPWFECWDVTGEEPKRRFQLRLPRAAGAGGGMGFVPGVQGSLAFSPSGAMAAYRTYGGEIVVYRMSDGEVHARFPLAGVPGDTFNGFRVVGRLYVSDDGERIVIRGENQMSVLERPGNRTTVRHVPVADLNDPQLGSITHGHLLADGKTYVQLDCPRDPRTNKARVRVWDVSRDPSRFEARALPPRVQAVSVQRDGNSFRRLAVADGRLFFEWPQAEASYDEEAKANGFAGELFGGPFVVRDPDGRELGTIPVKAERYTRPTAELLADGHRLLVHINVSGVGPKGTWAVNSTERWGLYDLDRGGREIAGGVGSLSRVPGAPYLIEHGSYAGAAGTGAVRFLILRHAATGDVFHRIEIPNRDVRFCEFDPTGKTYLVESVPRVERPAGPETAPAPRPVHSTAELALTGGAFAANPRPSRMPRVPPGGGWGVPGSKEGFGTVIGVPVPVRPVRIHLFDAATHRELLAWDVGPDRIRAAVSPARFSPDGKRILFRYVGGEPDMKAPPGMRPDGPARLWVARPDGRVEHDVALTGPLRVSSGGLGFGGRNPGVAESGKGVVCSPDGKHAALPVAGEIQIWDLDAGELRHTLTGHGGRGVDVLAAYSADGSRLFTVLFSWGSSAALTPAPIHVWDTATGRELLTLDTRRGDQTVPGAVGLEVVGGTLRLQGVRGVRTYDGTPVKP